MTARVARLELVDDARERRLSALYRYDRIWPVSAGLYVTTKRSFAIMDGSYGFRVRSIPYGLYSLPSPVGFDSFNC